MSESRETGCARCNELQQAADRALRYYDRPLAAKILARLAKHKAEEHRTP